MSPQTEQGFGTGLRALLRVKQGEAEAHQTPPEPQDVEPLAAEETTAPELDVRAELEDALGRERELRDALEHQVEAHERELAASRDLALQEAEVGQLAARLAGREAELAERQRTLDEREEQVANERRDLNLRRTDLVAEEARLTELAVHVDSRAAALESVDHEHAHGSAELAKQLAGIGERERELKRERAEVEERRVEAEARLAARERTLRKHDEAVRVREQAAAGEERRVQAEGAELERHLERLQARVEAVASREAEIEGRLAARENELADREAALGAWEERVRAQSDRAQRERAGHGRASQEAFSLMAELEQREDALKQREEALKEQEAELGARVTLNEAEAPKLQAREQMLVRSEAHLASLRERLDERLDQAGRAEQALAGRVEALEEAEHELRLREAQIGAELELRADKLEQLAEELAAAKAQLAERERDLAGYVTQLQEGFGRGELEPVRLPMAGGRSAA
jgi:chromosome segregation ATPase